MEKLITVNGKEYRIIKLLGKGKGDILIWQMTDLKNTC